MQAEHDQPLISAFSSTSPSTQGRGYHPASPDAVSPLPGEGSRDWSSWRGFSSTPKAEPAGGRLASLCHDVLSLGTTLPQVRVGRRFGAEGEGCVRLSMLSMLAAGWRHCATTCCLLGQRCLRCELGGWGGVYRRGCLQERLCDKVLVVGVGWCRCATTWRRSGPRCVLGELQQDGADYAAILNSVNSWPQTPAGSSPV